MLYIKTKLTDGRTLKSCIHADNTYAICSECGKEVPVKLGELFSEPDADPIHADIVCPDCTKQHLPKKEPTLEDIVLLATALSRFGYGKTILGLYDIFHIEAIDELQPMEYSAFAATLLWAISGEESA